MNFWGFFSLLACIAIVLLKKELPSGSSTIKARNSDSNVGVNDFPSNTSFDIPVMEGKFFLYFNLKETFENSYIWRIMNLVSNVCGRF